MINNFLFFDIDGVLINPLGYRQATKDTINRISSDFGLSKIKFLESDLAAFEAQGITSEWDMVPLYLLAWMEMCLRQYAPMSLISDRNDLAIYLHSVNHTNFAIAEIIEKLGEKLKPGMSPTESILNDIVFQSGGPKKLPLVQKYAAWLIQDLLSSTRDVDDSTTTRIFQNLVLGDQVFEEICGLSAAIKTDSYLIKYDKKFIDTITFAYLQDLIRLKSVHLCAITARPSLHPGFELINQTSGHYFPEAELAIKKIGLENLKVVGYGTLKFLAESVGMKSDALVKPSLIHALVALAVSCETNFDRILEFLRNNRERVGNQDKYSIGLKSILPEWVLKNKSIFHVFEDSAIGIRSVKSLNSFLVQNGIDSDVIAYGIAKDSLKVESLKRENARIFENINQALSYYFETKTI